MLHQCKELEAPVLRTEGSDLCFADEKSYASSKRRYGFPSCVLHSSTTALHKGQQE